MLQKKLSLHDVEDVEALCVRVLEQGGLELDHHDREDALAYLIATCWELSITYTSGIYRKGFAFYAGAGLRRRLTDWNRKRFGRTKWQFANRTYERARPHVDSLDRVGGPVPSGEVDGPTPSHADFMGLLGEGSSTGTGGERTVGEGKTRRAA